jgi:hypothetical protein
MESMEWKVETKLMTGWYVTANDIKNWTATNKRSAEENLPLLVKKLILASCKPTNIEFLSGDAISIGGWDGVLEVDTGNVFIPAGKSGWEIGTDNAVKGKADSDYSMRSRKPTPFKLDETTFVFVTSRLWTKRDNWVHTKKATKKWKDVKGINAETLQNWLESCPAVHRWFSELLGKRTADLWDVEQAWRIFAKATSVNVTPEFILHGRDDESNSLANLVSGPPNIYRIKSLSKKEAYGFIVASLMTDNASSSRCLIIKSQDSWDRMAESRQSLILIPIGFQPNGVGCAVANGHIVLLAVDDADAQMASITLNRQPRLVREACIQKLGFDERTASQLYQDTKGYLEPLLRHHLMQPIDYAAPSWPRTTSPVVLFAAFFAAEWSENNEYDKSALEALSGLPYSQFETAIIKLSKAEDPPIRLVGNVWQVISKVDLWLLIAALIAKPYIDRLDEVVAKVMADVDPSYDLPSDERYMANIRGAIPKYSNRLKHGLADTLALLSVYGDEYAAKMGGNKPSLQIAYWIRRFYEKNRDARFWYSLGSCVRLIAEAAPEEFLEAVENTSAGDSPTILGLFQAEGDGMFGGCYHSNLLWALELTSWEKKYLGKVSLCLAKLSEIDPGGKWSNRPFNSLVEIYLGWINNTSATHEERINIIEKLLIPQYPKIAWKLMLKLLFNSFQTSSGICKPEYREWSKDIERGTTTNAYYKYVRKIVDLLILEAENMNDEGLCDLVSNFGSYTDAQRQAIIKILLNIRINEISEKTRGEMLKKLRSTIAHHREYPDANWSWSSELLDQLENVYLHFDYDDLIKANTFLFNDHWPKLIDPLKHIGINYKEREAQLSRKRTAVVEAIYEGDGIEGLRRLIIDCSYPRLVGSVVYESSLSEELLPTVLSWFGENNKCGDFSDGYVLRLASNDAERAVLLLKENVAWLSTKKAKFLLSLPLIKNTFELVDELPTEGIVAYWSGLYNYFISGDDVDLVCYISRKLLENDRPLAAIDALAQAFHGKKDTNKIESDLIASILIKIAIDPTDIKSVSLESVSYDILKAIEFIQESGTLKEEQIRQIEWAYLRMLRYEGLNPQYLSKAVSEEPSFFAQLVMWTYKRNDGGAEPEEQLSEEQIRQRAEIAWELLDRISIIPGAEGNEINENQLNEWVDQARTILKNAGREDIGDDRLGHFLSRYPVGKDGIWPHEAVRAVVERIRSKCLDDAIECGKRNSRGTTSRHPYDGGEQERSLAKKYYAEAELIQLTSPRTANILRSIAKSYEWDADIHDRDVELRD